MSKIKDLKDKNPNFNIDLIQMLSDRDPSGTNKYLPFMVQSSQEFVKAYFNSGKFMQQAFFQLLNLVNNFEKYASENLLTQKDIYAYTHVDDIEDAIKEAEMRAEERNVKTTETLVLFEDADRILIKPLSKRSSAVYGKNTKWCTSENDGQAFASYSTEGCLLYFIFKHPPKNLPEAWRKLAFNHRKMADASTIWNATDQQISGGDVFRLAGIIGQDVMNIINIELDLCIPNVSLRKLEDDIVQIEKSLFDRTEFKDKRRPIEDYVSSLKGNREKNVLKPTTFKRTKAEDKLLGLIGETDGMVPIDAMPESRLDFAVRRVDAILEGNAMTSGEPPKLYANFFTPKSNDTGESIASF